MQNYVLKTVKENIANILNGHTISPEDLSEIIREIILIADKKGKAPQKYYICNICSLNDDCTNKDGQCRFDEF